MDSNAISPLQRRKFLMTMIGGMAGLIGLVAVWPVFRFLSPKAAGKDAERTVVNRTQVPVGGAHFFQYRGRPAVALQPKPGHFVVLSAVCTHLGCVVAWQENKSEFLCPCHGGRFSTTGQVLGGPPPKDLEIFPVAIDGELLVIG